jgi:dTMP kinase
MESLDSINACKSGKWISLDGTEGVGKSVLARYLAETVKNVVVTPEFSDGNTGNYLRNSVVKNPHFISSSLIEQSLLFLADFFCIYDLIVKPALANGQMVISDRGYVSKYVYQLLVISSGYQNKAVRKLLFSLFELVQPPDLTIYLSCSQNIQYQRLMERDGHCDDARMSFIRQANVEFKKFLKSKSMNYCHIHQASNMPLKEFLYQGEKEFNVFLKNHKTNY